MSFASELLDGYDILRKRTNASLEASRAFGSFIKNFAMVQKECHAKMLEFLHRSRKEHMAKMDYSVQAAIQTTLDQLELVYESQASFTDALLEQRKEVDITLKEKEKRQKVLIKDGDTLEKSWEAQLEGLKKARANYVKLGKEAQAMTENLEKRKQDPRTKPELVSQLASKALAASEKRDQAESQYRSVLEATNTKMDVYYSSEQPQLLDQYQAFEQDRIFYLRDQFLRFITIFRSSNLANIFNDSCATIEKSSNAIDENSDTAQWAQSAGKHYAIPEPIPFLTYDLDGGVAPEMTTNGRRAQSGGVSVSSNVSISSVAASTAPSTARRPAPTPNIASGLSSMTGAAAVTKPTQKAFDPSKYNIPSSDINDTAKFDPAVRKMIAVVEEDIRKFQKDIAALDKLLPMYEKDPSASRTVSAEMATLKSNLEQLNFIHADLLNALAEKGGGGSSVSGGSGGSSTTTAAAGSAGAGHKNDLSSYSEHTLTNALYDYSAANETELSFNEGDKLVILQRDDSGWWFASLNGREGFVPANYMEG